MNERTHKLVGWVLFAILVVELGCLIVGAFAGIYFAWRGDV